MTPPRKAVHSVNALVAEIAGVHEGIVALDGCPLAGKSTVRVLICERLGAIGLELDRFLTREQGKYVDALRADDISVAVQDALSRSSIVVLDGVCMRAILAALGLAARLHVYVQPISPSGVLRNIETLDAENGKPLDPTVAPFFSELDHEVFRYHAAYQPFNRANVIYYRADE